MKKLVFILFSAFLFSCNSNPTDKVVTDLGNALNGWDKQTEPIEPGFYIKKNIEIKKGIMPEDLKNIIDKDLNSTPTKVNENWFNDNNYLMNDYYWDLPKLNIHLESKFKDSKYTYKLWATKK
jgi:hypothetical protein